MYGEQFGGVFAKRGQRISIDDKGKKTQGEAVGDPKKLNDAIKKGDWNEYHIIAKGYNIKQSINGQLMAEVTDNGPKKRRQGILAFQLHAGPPMTVQFKDVMLKRLKLVDAKKSGADVVGSDDLLKKISDKDINFDKLICTPSMLSLIHI